MPPRVRRVSDPPEWDLHDHVVIVTGATRGIGLGIATYLGQQGARLVITGRKPDRLQAASELLSAAEVDHLAVTADTGNRDRAFEVAEAARTRWGRLDGLVANAQSFRPVTALIDVSSADMDVLFETGPKGTLWSMQAAFAAMADAGRGRIVTMATSMGLTGAAGYGPYAASNEAIRSLTRTAAQEWGRFGITVNCVLPASAAHRMDPDGNSERAAAFAAMYEDHPIGRDGDPLTDIAPAVAFLLSDASRYVTGQTIAVDGGGIMRA
jgi:NAD(P)-dependent dehydrogenase (short-subunit alcohol dehydrogenase family)